MAHVAIALDTNLKNMVEEFTTEQKNQLKTWAEQRDEILLEISNARATEEKLQATNKDLAAGNTDIEFRYHEIRGRIEELKIKEGELPALISKEVAFLESKKASLEAQIPVLEKVIKVLIPQKDALEADIEKALATFEVIKGETLLLDKIANEVTVVSKTNSDKINLLVSNLAKSLEEIISVNRKNVTETNIVIDKLPAMMMELQKAGILKSREALIKIKK